MLDGPTADSRLGATYSDQARVVHRGLNQSYCQNLDIIPRDQGSKMGQVIEEEGCDWREIRGGWPETVLLWSTRGLRWTALPRAVLVEKRRNLCQSRIRGLSWPSDGRHIWGILGERSITERKSDEWARQADRSIQRRKSKWIWALCVSRRKNQ